MSAAGTRNLGEGALSLYKVAWNAGSKLLTAPAKEEMGAGYFLLRL